MAEASLYDIASPVEAPLQHPNVGSSTTCYKEDQLRLYASIETDPLGLQVWVMCFSDLEVRRQLGQPSIDCLLLGRRMLYL